MTEYDNGVALLSFQDIVINKHKRKFKVKKVRKNNFGVYIYHLIPLDNSKKEIIINNKILKENYKIEERKKDI